MQGESWVAETLTSGHGYVDMGGVVEGVQDNIGMGGVLMVVG